MRKSLIKTKSRTHFEQVPLEALEKLPLQEITAKKGTVLKLGVKSPTSKTQPYSVRISPDTGR